MDLFAQLRQHAQVRGGQPAVIASDRCLTYEELDRYSSRLAGWLLEQYGSDHTPIVVYGHKSAFMLVCFFACAKAGHAYCPVDQSLPRSRFADILAAVQPPVVLCTQDPGFAVPNAVGAQAIAETACSQGPLAPPEAALAPGDTYYIIFTSGSTGTPKGVEIPRRCLENFLDWSSGLAGPMEQKAGKVFLNQAPFSFDLSVLDTYTSLDCGGTLRTLDRSVQDDYAALMAFLKDSRAAYWISTPSFADMCLAEEQFGQGLLPELEAFLFCGETLNCSTADKLLHRFPRAKVINTYGPTESTVAVTDVEITPALAAGPAALPVGRPKPGTRLAILAESGAPLPEGAHGEIVILGDTVGAGYFRRPDLTERAFFTQTEDGQALRAYRTGDIGWLQGGMLYFSGRADGQLKLHGYRIELGDIEENLMRLPGIGRAVVLPSIREGKVKSLTGYVEGRPAGGDRLAAVRQIKDQLRQLLPDYMVPKKIVFLDRLPVTANGKTDRKALKELTQ